MRDLDNLIEAALEDEERELLRSIGEKPGFVERASEYADAATIPRLLFLLAEKL